MVARTADNGSYTHESVRSECRSRVCSTVRAWTYGKRPWEHRRQRNQPCTCQSCVVSIRCPYALIASVAIRGMRVRCGGPELSRESRRVEGMVDDLPIVNDESCDFLCIDCQPSDPFDIMKRAGSPQTRRSSASKGEGDVQELRGARTLHDGGLCKVKKN